MVQNLLLTVISLGSSAKQSKSLNVHTYRIQHKAAFCLVIRRSRSLHFTVNSRLRQVPLCWLHVLLSPPLCCEGPCILSGLHAFCRAEFCHRARAGGRAGRRNPEAPGTDAGGEARGQAASAGANTPPSGCVVLLQRNKKTVWVLALWGSCRKMKDLCWAVFR